MVDLSIIIVNYKSAGLVIDCIESIYKNTTKHSFEIILVDNNSQDDCRERVLSKYKEVQWVQMDYNSGFARANNAGIRVSCGANILLLNSDTIILENALDKTLRLFEQYPDAAGCGVQLLNPDMTHQASGANVVRGGLNMLLPLPYLGNLVRKAGYKFKVSAPSIISVPPVLEVDWIVGAFLMARKKILLDGGLLDEDFFMYAEEIEWCSRLRKKGALLLFEEPKVMHIGGGSSTEYYNAEDNQNGKTVWDEKGLQERLSNLLRVRKEFGVAWLFVITAFYVFEIPVFFFGLAIEKILKPGKSKYKWQQVLGYTKNIMIMLKYFPRMVINKPYFYKVI